MLNIEIPALLKFRLFSPDHLQKPDNKQLCYIICKADGGKLYQTIATYIGKQKTPAEEFCDESLWDDSDLDYDDDTDTYFTPEGFYEGSVYAETKWRIDDEVLAFSPILSLAQKEVIIKALQPIPGF